MAHNDEFGDITLYLKRLSAGDGDAEGPLAEAVYAQMRRMARWLVQSRQGDRCVQATALVNDVLLELVRLRSIDWQDRVHFYRVASRLLRRRLIDHIRAAGAQKRPQENARIDIEDILLPAESRYEEILSVHQGLDRLTLLDPPLAELIEMIYFGGVTISAAAELRGVSEKTINRHLDLGRRWLASKFQNNCPFLSTNNATFDRP